MVGGFAIIMTFLFAGDLISSTGIPIPGSVIGMVLLAVALRLGIVRKEWIRSAAQFLVENLSLLFVPAGVGVMAYFNVVQRSWLPVSISVLVSTLVVLAFTGLLEDRLRRLVERIRGERKE